MQEAALHAVNDHGKAHTATLLRVFEEFLKDVSSTLISTKSH